MLNAKLVADFDEAITTLQDVLASHGEGDATTIDKVIGGIAAMIRVVNTPHRK